MRPTKATILALAAVLAIAAPAFVLAQAPQPAQGTAGAAASDHAAGMQAAQQRMNERMTQAMWQGGDADRSFAAAMIPHHEGAVEMARAALPAIRDPELRRMAEKTIADNEREARQLQTWMQRHR